MKIRIWIAATSIAFGGSAMAQSITEAEPERIVVRNEKMLGECLTEIQRQYFPVCLPSLSERLLQPAGSLPVDFSGFSADTKKHFQGWIDQDFIVHYSIGLYEDFETGAVVVLDANSGRELFRIP